MNMRIVNTLEVLKTLRLDEFILEVQVNTGEKKLRA